MIIPFAFLLFCGWKNRVLSRLRKLRNPKYLVSALAGLAYLYFVFVHQPLLQAPRVPRNEAPSDPGMLVLAESGFALMLMLAVAFQWFSSKSKTPLFNEAEVQFLFPAPVTRGTLLNYRIARSQIGILFGSLISFLILGRGRLFPNAAFAIVTIWAVYSFLFLFRIGALIEKQSIARQGAGGRRRRTWILAMVLMLLIAGAAYSRRYYPPPPSGGGITEENMVAWLITVAGSGPIYYALFPFRTLVRPASASGYLEFLLRFAPVLLVIAAVYAWVRRGTGVFEEAATGTTGSEMIVSTFTEGQPGRKKAQRASRRAFRLKPEGFAPIGIYWKNLSLFGALATRRTWPRLAALAVVSILVVSASGQQTSVILGSVCVALAGFLTLMGPVLFRDDLRMDLVNIDLLKAYPLPGWGIVLGEVLAPATVLTLLEWSLIAFAASLWTGFESHAWKLSHRIYAGVAAAMLMPCLSMIGILAQNAAVLLLPGWVQLGREHQRGVEAMGQRLISGLATMLSLLIAAIPAALLFFAVWVAGYWILGLAVIPLAALVAALGLLAESAVGVFLLGRAFDKFDASKELG